MWRAGHLSKTLSLWSRAKRCSKTEIVQGSLPVLNEHLGRYGSVGTSASLTLHENRRQNKHVESRVVTRLDQSSNLCRSTKEKRAVFLVKHSSLYLLVVSPITLCKMPKQLLKKLTQPFELLISRLTLIQNLIHSTSNRKTYPD